MRWGFHNINYFDLSVYPNSRCVYMSTGEICSLCGSRLPHVRYDLWAGIIRHRWEQELLAALTLLQNTEVQVKNSRLPPAAEILSQGYTGCDLNSCGFGPFVAYFLKSLLIYFKLLGSSRKANLVKIFLFLPLEMTPTKYSSTPLKIGTLLKHSHSRSN